MRYIPNQPVSFSSSTTYPSGIIDCSSDEVVYNQLVDNAEETQFQMSIEPCEDAEELLENPYFEDTTGWDLQANWQFGIGTLCAIEATASVESTDLIPEGYYKFTFTVSSFSGDALDVYLDGNVVYSISSTGTFYIYFDSPVGGCNLELIPNLTTSICFTEISALPLLKDVEVKVFNEDENEIASITQITNPEYFVFVKDTVTVTINWAALGAASQCVYLIVINPCNGSQLYSNMFKLGGYIDGCTLLINSCNNNDSMGFVFTDSGFSPRIRLDAKLKTASYNYEKSVYEDSQGTKLAYNFGSRKAKTLAINLQPEYVHDYLATLAGYDNLYISNVEYFVEDDEYQVVYGEVLESHGTSEITVSLKTQNVKNTICTSNVNSCNLA